MDSDTIYGKRGAIKLQTPVKVISTAAVGGKKEKEGPIGQYLDDFFEEADMNLGAFEKAESEMCRRALAFALEKAGLSDKNIDCLLGGDLINQCTSTGYGLDAFDIPYLGLYGACSTMAEGILIGSLLIESGRMNSVAVVVSSHFCSAERQVRFPLGYGSFSGPTAQTTVTGAAAFILARSDGSSPGVYIDELLPGIVCDRGIKDAGNMGAAMCSAAADTVVRYLKSSGKTVNDFDLIATGDLGWEGLKLFLEFTKEDIPSGTGKINDCGVIVYDITKQNVGCGGSGCGCSAICTAGAFYSKLTSGEYRNVAVIGTGAMMSPHSLKQGFSIPAVAHLVTFKSRI